MYSGACFVIWKKEFLPNFDRKIKKSFRVYLTQAEGIVIGPRSLQDVDSLQMFVEENGYMILKDKISKSDCPLR